MKTSGSAKVPEEAMESLVLTLEAMVVEEMESSIPVPMVVALRKREPPTPVSKAVSREAGILGQEDIVIPTVELGGFRFQGRMWIL